MLADLLLLTASCLCFALGVALLRLAWRVITAHPSEIAEARRWRESRALLKSVRSALQTIESNKHG